MNLRTAAINVCFYTDAGAIHRNDNSRCAIRFDQNATFTVQVNWDRPSRHLPILEVDYRGNDRDHRFFVRDKKNILSHIMHAHITSIKNLLMAFNCGVSKVDDEYPTTKHERRHGAFLYVKKTILNDHWQTTMTQYRGLSSHIIKEIGRILGMEGHCIIILSDIKEELDYDIVDTEEETEAAQLIYQRHLRIVDYVRRMGNSKSSLTSYQP